MVFSSKILIHPFKFRGTLLIEYILFMLYINNFNLHSTNFITPKEKRPCSGSIFNPVDDFFYQYL
jgi:hypothetical protein